MKSLIRKANKLTEVLKARQLRKEGRCPRCGLPVAEKIVVFRDKPPEVCSCEPRMFIDMSGPSVEFKALDVQTGQLITIEEMQSKCMKDEVQDDE